MLAALGQFCKELVEGWIPSTTTWSRAYAWFIWMVFGQQESCRLPTCISGWLPDFFLTLCALLSRFCVMQFCGYNVLPRPVLPDSFSRAMSLGIMHPLTTSKESFLLQLTFQPSAFSGILSQMLTASCRTAFRTWKLVHPAPLTTSTISPQCAMQHITLHCST